LVRVCNKRCASRSVHCICCFFTNRRLTTWLMVDSTSYEEPNRVFRLLAAYITVHRNHWSYTFVGTLRTNFYTDAAGTPDRGKRKLLTTWTVYTPPP
jgi:hypothetical protein